MKRTKREINNLIHENIDHLNKWEDNKNTDLVRVERAYQNMIHTLAHERQENIEIFDQMKETIEDNLRQIELNTKKKVALRNILSENSAEYIRYIERESRRLKEYNNRMEMEMQMAEKIIEKTTFELDSLDKDHEEPVLMKQNDRVISIESSQMYLNDRSPIPTVSNLIDRIMRYFGMEQEGESEPTLLSIQSRLPTFYKLSRTPLPDDFVNLFVVYRNLASDSIVVRNDAQPILDADNLIPVLLFGAKALTIRKQVRQTSVEIPLYQINSAEALKHFRKNILSTWTKTQTQKGGSRYNTLFSIVSTLYVFKSIRLQYHRMYEAKIDKWTRILLDYGLSLILGILLLGGRMDHIAYPLLLDNMASIFVLSLDGYEQMAMAPFFLSYFVLL